MQNVNLFEFGGNFAKLYRREEPRPAHKARLALLAAVTAAKAVRADTVFWSVLETELMFDSHDGVPAREQQHVWRNNHRRVFRDVFCYINT